ncbi:MAG: hypothetical protein N2D54_11725 [Chloroflexota bacterium]
MQPEQNQYSEIDKMFEEAIKTLLGGLDALLYELRLGGIDKFQADIEEFDLEYALMALQKIIDSVRYESQLDRHIQELRTSMEALTQ